MLRPRIIPCLLVHNGGLVKTVQFGAPKYVGDPLNAVRIFNEKEVDELMVLDIDASRYGRSPNENLIAQLAAECRMPLCYGGGVKTVEQFERLIALGVEKVAVSSAAVDEPELISRVAERVGSQSVVVVIDVKTRQVPRAASTSSPDATRAGWWSPGSSTRDCPGTEPRLTLEEALVLRRRVVRFESIRRSLGATARHCCEGPHSRRARELCLPGPQAPR